MKRTQIVAVVLLFSLLVAAGPVATGAQGAAPRPAAPAACIPGPHSGAILASEEWCLADSPHVVSGDVTVNAGVTLTIEPGVEVRFNASTGLVNSGALWAVGTISQPITFTSILTAPYPGAWDGIGFSSTTLDGQSRLERCTVEYGGTLLLLDSYNFYGNVAANSSSPTIQHCTLRHSDRHGLHIRLSDAAVLSNTIALNTDRGIADETNTDAPTVRGNTFSQNGSPGWLSPNAILGANTFFSETNNYLGLLGGTLSADRAWPAQEGGALAVDGQVNVAPGLTLTVEPGAEVRFAFNSGLVNSGALWAVGTISQPITFTSILTAPYPGAWDGIGFSSTTLDGQSRLERCTVEYGGTLLLLDSYNFYGNVAVNSAAPTLQDCTLRHSSQHGLHMRWADTVILSNTLFGNADAGIREEFTTNAPTVRGNTFSQNGVPGWLSPNAVVGANTFLSETNNYLGLLGGTLSADRAWPAQQGGALAVDGQVNVAPGVTLSIAPGAEVRFAFNSGLVNSGALWAVGTVTQPITFTSILTAPYPGAWDGIGFSNTTLDGQSRLEHCTVEYGGTLLQLDSFNFYGNVAVNSAAPTLQDCILRHSSQHGLHMRWADTVILSNTLFGNADAGIREEFTTNAPTVRGNAFSQNGVPGWISPNTVVGVNTFFSETNNYLGLLGGTLSADRAWPAQEGGALAVDGQVNVAPGVTLTIEPGTEVRFAFNSGLVNSGALWAVGTISQPITFTSILTAPYPGAWDGVGFSNTTMDGQSRLEHCTVEYGGTLLLLDSFNFYANVAVNSSSPAIRDCTIRYGSSRGVEIRLGSPGIAGTLVTANGGDGVTVYGSAVTIISSTLAGNTGRGLLLQSSAADMACTAVTGNGAEGIRLETASSLFLLGSNILGNAAYGLNNTTAVPVWARYNWWGDASGPGGTGPGSGDEVSANVYYEPWLEAPECIPALVTGTVSPVLGVTLVYTDPAGISTTVEVPAGAVGELIELVYVPRVTTTHPLPPARRLARHTFDLDAFRNDVLLPEFSFAAPVTITVHYDDADIAGLAEGSLGLRYWDGGAWPDAAQTCTPPSRYEHDLAGNELRVAICHLTQWGMMGVPRENLVYLPLVLR